MISLTDICFTKSAMRSRNNKCIVIWRISTNTCWLFYLMIFYIHLPAISWSPSFQLSVQDNFTFEILFWSISGGHYNGLWISPLRVGRLISSFVHIYSYNLVWHDLHLPLPITTTSWEVGFLIFPCLRVQPCMTGISSTSAYHHYWLGGWFPHLSMSTRTTVYDMIYIYLCLSPLLVGRFISSFVNV
jgi:hypothetical protein